MKPTVIHHSADYDGLFCREIAKKFLPDAELIGWDYGDPLVKVCSIGGSKIYVLDLSPDCIDPLCLGGKEMENLVWIDHHKSAISKWSPSIAGYRIDGVSACRLAWHWFVCQPAWTHPEVLARKEDYVNRIVSEPLAVLLAGEYDVWDHRGDGDLEFQFGLDAQTEIPWRLLLRPNNFDRLMVDQIIQDGAAAMRCYAKRDADIMRTRSFKAEFEGLWFLALNTARCNSNSFAALDVEGTGHDALMAFFWTGKDWSVSLYHAAHRKDLDLSLIAVKNGGGGHRGACGFRAKNLSFL